MISLADLKRRIDGGELSPEAALKQSQDAIATQEKVIGAFANLAENPQAQKAGPLRGIAVDIHGTMDRSRATRADVSLFSSVRLHFRMQGISEQQGRLLLELFKGR